MVDCIEVAGCLVTPSQTTPPSAHSNPLHCQAAGVHQLQEGVKRPHLCLQHLGLLLEVAGGATSFLNEARTPSNRDFAAHLVLALQVLLLFHDGTEACDVLQQAVSSRVL